VTRTTTLTPGQRHRLASLGYTADLVGKVWNRALPVPKNADELEEMLNDGSRIAPVVASKESLKDFVLAYAREQQGDGTELRRMVTEEVQRGVAQMLTDNAVDKDAAEGIKRLNLDPQSGRASMLTSHRQGTAYNANAAGAVLDNEFKNAADYFHTAWHLNKNPDAHAKMARIRNAYSSVVPSEGGFLVPETLRSQLLQIALESSVVRPRATVIPMDSARVPIPMIDSTTNAGSVFGGMISYWAEESAMLQESNPKFGRVVLDASKLTGLAVVPNELLNDSLVSFATLVETLWPKVIAFD
jgi:HK97 family phage major capsid protein